jgi:outer membrane protein assembly factor BamB
MLFAPGFSWSKGTFQPIFIAVAAVTACTVLLPTEVVRGQEGMLSNVFPPAPRELRQHVTRSQAAMAEERYSDAVAELGQVLNSALGDDFFLGGAGDSQISLKTQALDLLGSMPARGQRMYELQFGAEARVALESALQDNDLAAITEVSRRYFHTKAGYEATLLVGRLQLGQGRPLAAALTLKRVADVPNAAGQYDPELSVLLATCWLHAGQPELASETLLAIKARQPSAKVRLVEGPTPLFERDEEALAWLERIVGAPRGTGSLTAKEWVVYRGNEARNARSLSGVPLLNFSWKLPTVNDPQDEARVAQRARAARDSGEPLISSLQPLVVHDYAIVRQPESNKLVGINLKKSGKREWVFPPFDDHPGMQAARQTVQTARSATINTREHELKQRIWDDNPFGQVSSDGKQVYVIDELGYAALSNVAQQQMIVLPGGRGVRNMGGARPHNVLVALDLKRQGAQVWGVGGDRGDDNPALAGAFFLGPPLPLGDQLFALAEFSGEVRLVCLNPASGALEWKQQLAVLEDGQHIVADTTRRLAGASPSYADGVLVCPTSAGAVVAVDLATRTLRWGYQYPRSDLVRTGGRGGFRNIPQLQTSTQGQWLDATATIADGVVILTPPESQELHCLDLLSGKPRWPARPRDEMLMVACVHDGKIVLVGNSGLKAINLADGKDAWDKPLDLEGATPTGRGYYSDNFYFLPVAGRELLKIDLDEGTIVSRAQTEIELGNVVAYQDQLISVSPQYAASFVLLSEALQQKLEERLAADSRDIEALSLRGQILLQEGKPDESLTLLRRAHELAPEKTVVRELLVKVMLALLRQDLAAHIELTEELDKLATEPAERREALRWRIQGLAHSGQAWNAFEALMELADYELNDETRSPGEELEAVDRELSVRTDRWIQGQLYRIEQAADGPMRERMSAEIQARLQRLLPDANTHRLRAFLNLFGFHEASHPARLALAERLLEADALLEAELLASEVLTSSDRTLVGASHAVLAAAYEKGRRNELAVRQYERLGAEFADVVCRQGLTGDELRTASQQNAALKPWLAAAWPMGEVEVKDEAPSAGSRPVFQRMYHPIQISEFYGGVSGGLRALYDPSQMQISVRSETGQQLCVASLRTAETAQRPFYFPSGTPLGGKARGHLLIIPVGTDVVAIDALRGDRSSGDALLWRQETADVDSRQRGQVYLQQRMVSNPLTGNRYQLYDATGRLNFNTGPVSMAGVCYQKGRQLYCVDPLSGQPLWERGGVPAHAEIFGDGETVFVADASGDDVLVLNAIDGSLMGKRNIDRADRRWTTHGRNVLAFEQQGATINIRLYDALAEEGGRAASLWARKVPMGTRGTLIDGEDLGLLEPGGQFTIVSLATGETRFAVPLDPEPSLAWINVLRSRDQYLLLAGQEVAENTPGVSIQPLQPVNNPQSRFQGRVYAFSRATGKLQWHAPAYVSQQCLPADQPVESPLLVFACNRTESRGGGSRTSPSLLVLDRRNGRIVHDAAVGTNQPATHCDIVADPLRQTVTLHFASQSSVSRPVVLKLTDRPIPPQPPAQTGDMASDRAGQPPGVVDRSVGAAVEQLNRDARRGRR